MCKDCKGSEPYTKERFEEIRARLEAKGFSVITRWRPGLKHIRTGDIVLEKQS